MQTAGSFNCPHCAGPVPFQYGQHTVECEYCGNTVIVPPELRPPPPPPTYQYSQVQVVIGPEGTYTPQGNAQPVYATPQTATVSRRRSSCLPVLIFTIVLLFIAGGVVSFLAASTPFFFDNLFAGGFARLEQTYGSDDATPNAQSLGVVSDAMDVDLDGAGNIYVVTYDGRVVRFAPDGTSLGSWSIEGKDIHPDAIEVDSAGNVYIPVKTDIRKYDGATGFEQHTITTPEIFGMSDAALAPDGSVLSFLGGPLDQIIRFDPTGMEVARYQRPFTEFEPEATTAPWLIRIAADSRGYIYLLNTSSTGTPVFVFTPEGEHLIHFGIRGSAEGQFGSPGAIAVDSKGRVYVSDSGGVQVYEHDGQYVGIIRMPFSYRANGIAFDKQDRLYVVSRNQKKVYRFVLNEP